MSGSRRRPAGFTFLEVMTAMVVLSVGLLAVVGLFEMGFKALQIGHRRTLAGQLAQNKMEALRSSSPALLSSGADSPQGMARSWSIQQSIKDPRILIIDVKVSWKDSQDQDQSISLKSFLFN